ncbi:MAG: flagellar hook-associated protein FlgK [Spirochaetes bacterium GWF1_51_8]|nr:MAG: flagellar hook-associated protein FlgK [Spirochaetes bacterium GWF1_51_8]
MLSTFHGVELGKKGLNAHQVGMDTIAHNLGNIETPGFSKQKVNNTTFHPIYEPSANHPNQAGQIGTGVMVENIERVKDALIDDQIFYEKGGLGFWDAKQDYLHKIEMLMNEPGKPNIRTVMDAMWEGITKVVQDPTEIAARFELIERAKAVTDTVNHVYNSLSKLQEDANMLIIDKVAEINSMASEIAKLNVQIVKSEALGDNPNDLYDKRDLLIDKLSKLIDIKVERKNNKEVIIYLGSENLVQGPIFNPLVAKSNPDNKGFVDIQWEDGRSVRLGEGYLAGLLSARDEDLQGAMNNINSLAVNLTDAFNEVHKDGFGLNKSTDVNFFKAIPLSPYADGGYDFNNDGVVDGTALFKVSGTEVLKKETLAGTGGYLNFGPSKANGPDIVVQYQPTDTIQAVMDKINQSEAGVTAYLNHKGQLSLKAKFPSDNSFPEFAIRHIEDSGNLLTGVAGLLAGSGAQNSFDYKNVNGIAKFISPANNISFTPQTNPAGWMAVDDMILADPQTIAASGGIDTTGDGNPNMMNGLADNRNAMALMDLRYAKIMVESQSTFGEFFQSIIGDFGERSKTAITNFDKNDGVVQSLQNLKDKISGVNVDEELTKMLQFQHGYNASAKLVTVFDRMLETILRMGA